MIKTLVPTGNEASAGVVRRGVGPQANPFASHIPRYGYGGFQDHEITARILPDLDKDSKPVSPFASLAPYNIADSERPCVGVNRSAGIVWLARRTLMYYHYSTVPIPSLVVEGKRILAWLIHRV